MTSLEIGGRSVKRAVSTARGAYVVELRPEGVMIRERGRRTWYGPVGYGTIFMTGAKIAADEIRRQRALRRKLKARQ